MRPLLRRHGGLLFALIVVIALASRAAGAGVFNPASFSLANGMQVFVIENRRAPVVTHMVWYKVGAIDEPQGQSGIAHLLEHLMFKGTATRASGEFSAIVARHGGQENAFTGHDYTAFYQNVAREHLGLMMELEADRMTGLKVTADEVAPEIQVVLEERLSRVDNDPAALLAEQAAATQYFNSNYKRPIIGWEHEIRGLTPEAIRAFYQRWYHPANAVLVVAGDIAADEVRVLAERTYGRIAAKPVPAHVELVEPPQRAARRLALADERVRQPAWNRGYLAPGYRTAGAEHAHALQLLAEILGGGRTSRLYRELVQDAELAVSASAGYDPMRRGASRFVVAAAPRPGIAVETIEAAVETSLARLLADGVDEAEIERAKRRMLAEAVYARDSLTTGARLLGEAAAVGAGIDAVEQWPERIAAVTKADIDAAARAVLTAGQSVTAVLLPRPGSVAEAGQ
ncbi:MAG: insulinase family protein [Rhodospirillales bacterium]|nr:insulinase family protein [Rhodospirillales bacterium]